jgi:hypothetical protein
VLYFIFKNLSRTILSVFLVNLKELDDYNEAAESAERRQEFESDLHQNLELWDSLMKVSYFKSFYDCYFS